MISYISPLQYLPSSKPSQIAASLLGADTISFNEEKKKKVTPVIPSNVSVLLFAGVYLYIPHMSHLTVAIQSPTADGGLGLV